MNNTFQGIMTMASSLRDEVESDGAAAELDIIGEACERGAELIRHLSGLAVGRDLRSRSSLEQLVDDVSQLLRRTVSRRIAIETRQVADNVAITGDFGQMGHVLIVLALDAIERLGGRGRLVLRAEPLEVGASECQIYRCPEGSYVRLRVSAKPTDERSAAPELAGSATVGDAVEQLGGVVVYEPGHVEILLPLCENTGRIRRTTDRGQLVPTRSPGTVLLVDDEDLVRRGVGRLLETLGHTVLCARDGREAVSLFAERHAEIDLVMLDLVMPEMGGAEAFGELRAIDPRVPILLCSGYSKEGTAQELLARGAAGFLQKPFNREQLVSALNKAVARGGRRARV